MCAQDKEQADAGQEEYPRGWFGNRTRIRTRIRGYDIQGPGAIALTGRGIAECTGRTHKLRAGEVAVSNLREGIGQGGTYGQIVILGKGYGVSPRFQAE